MDVGICLEAGAEVPTYGSRGAAGADVRAYLTESVSIEPGCSLLIPTGIRLSIPDGYEVQVRPRSGLALKEMITVLNTPGTIDADYRGLVGVILINHGKKRFVVEPNMRIAQLVLVKVEQMQFVQEEALSGTLRGEGGFGHTGLQ